MTVKIKYTKLFIDNEWVDSKSGKTFETFSPTDGSVIAKVSEGDKADVDEAVKAARRAFHRNSEWRLMNASERGEILQKFANLVERDIDYLSQLESLNNGTVMKFCKLILRSGVKNIRYIASLADKVQGDTVPIVDLAVQIAALGVFTHQGQICIAASRLYVQSTIYDRFVEAAVEHARKIKVGDPNDPTTDQGPQIDELMMNKVLGYIEKGKSEGAKLLCGGKRIGTKGYYLEPTVFSDVKDDMIIAKEEIFGPVQSIIKFDTLEEVIDRANNTNYGLASGIITTNIENALQFSKHVETGVVWVNTYLSNGAQAPFGGFKDSGLGRENGVNTLDPYLEVKTVCIALPKKF